MCKAQIYVEHIKRYTVELGIKISWGEENLNKSKKALRGTVMKI